MTDITQGQDVEASAPKEAPPAAASAAPDVDDLFPKQDVDDLFPANYKPTSQPVRNVSPIQDMIFSDPGRAHARILDAFGYGFKQDWGAGEHEASEANEYFKKAGIYNDYAKGQRNIIKAANEAIMRPAVAAIVAAKSTMSGAFHGVQEAIAQTGEEYGAPQLGRELAGGLEAFPTGIHQPMGVPHLPEPARAAPAAGETFRMADGTTKTIAPIPQQTLVPHVMDMIEQAKDLKVIGSGEAGYFGTKAVETEAPETQAQAAKAAGVTAKDWNETLLGQKPGEAPSPTALIEGTVKASEVAGKQAIAPNEPEAEETTAPPALRSIIPQAIVDDVKKNLMAAGRPEAEAEAAAQVIASHYQARAERFEGAKGSAEQLYEAEGPVIRGRGVVPAQEAPKALTEAAPADRASLEKLIAEGASSEEIAAHPIVKAAQDDNRARLQTKDLPGYGTPEFRENREFNFDGEKVRGYDAATTRLVEGAKSFSSKGPVRNEREATIVLGPPASGKSRLSETFARERHAAIVDSDEAKKAIPEYDKGAGTTAVHEESSDLTFGENGVLERLMDEGSNLVLPKVGHSASSIRQIVAGLKAEGYKVNLVNMNVAPEEAYRRMIRRFLKTGRVIGSDYFGSVGDKPTQTYYALKGEGGLHEAADIDVNGPPGAERFIDGKDTTLEANLRSGRDREPEDSRNLEAPAEPQTEAAVAHRPEEPDAGKLLSVANNVADEWQDKLGSDVHVIMGGSLVSKTYVRGGNEPIDMDIRFLTNNPERDYAKVEAATGLKLRKMLDVDDYPSGSSRAYLVEGPLTRDGITFDVEAMVRTPSYVGWARFYPKVMTADELSAFRADKARLKGNKYEYKALKARMLAEVRRRVDELGGPNSIDHVEPAQAATIAADHVNELTPAEQKRELPVYSPAAETAPKGPDQPAGVFMFDPTALNVDAKRFQFKSGGDEYGVTGALRNVTKWDPAKAQAIIVWEQNDGQLYVADGHQRAGLARRLTEQGNAKDIQLPGILYREKDGVSADDIRAVAAVTNIANGSGSALDGAKVLRARPDLMDGSLPLSVGKGKQAAALARLGDEPFRMVVNDVVPEHYGAVVGELIPHDAARQEAALKAIARFEPKNADEAAVLTQRVAQAELAKAEAGSQSSMFGDLETPESTAGEEMKIVGRAIADLKKDRALFARVLANAERIEETGSQIEREAAQGITSDAEVFAKTLTSEAYSAGPLRTELIAAARDLKNGKTTIGEATGRILAALRRQAEAHGADRAGAVEREPEKEFAQSDSDLFEAGAEGKPQALIPGVKPVTQRDLVQAAANKPLAPKKPQKAIGGLFGDSMDQKELFQTAYHGSPYDFDVFDTGKIGTGEGAQAYGHGLYFAENDKVAKGYRDALSQGVGNRQTAEGAADRFVSQYGDGAAAALEREIATMRSQGEKLRAAGKGIPQVFFDRIKNEYEPALEMVRKGYKPGGNLYRVDIKPEPHEFLQWDKPLNEQTPEIRAKIDATMERVAGIKDYTSKEHLGGRSPSSLIYDLSHKSLTGSAASASKALAESGIPGIRYADQGSRVSPFRVYSEGNDFYVGSPKVSREAGPFTTLAQADAWKAAKDAETQTHNYVVFDPKDIEILDKNGKPVTKAEYEQTMRGKIRLRENAKPIITLFKDANASTFLHETGHQWLEELMADAKDERAPEGLKTDADTVLKWLGVDSADAIKTRHHEQFARGFETYMMEGKAPSQALANVFARFKDWLTRIYQAVLRLKSPINDEVRGVFDRLIVKNPETGVRAPTFDDLHEAAAESTPPHQAREVASTIAAERDRITASHLPEAQDARLEGVGSGTQRLPPGGQQPVGDGHAAESRAGQEGAPASAGALGAGGIETAAQGDRASPEPAKHPVDATADLPKSETQLIDKAGNIRLDNLRLPEDVNAVIRATAAENNDFLAARRNVIPDAEVLALADALGMDVAQLSDRKLGQAFNAEQIVAARKLLIQSAGNVRDAAAKIAGGTEQDILAYAQARARHLMIQEQVSGITAEAGRALRAFRDMDGSKEAADISAFLKNTQGKTLFQMEEEGRLLAMMGTPQMVSKAIHEANLTRWQKIRSGILSWFVNNLISGPITHAGYDIGNTVTQLFKATVDTSVAAAISAFRDLKPEEKVYFGEVGAQLYGMVRGMRDGYSPAITALKTGVPYMKGDVGGMIGQIEAAYRPQAIPGKIGYVMETPSRAVTAIHTMHYSMNYEAEIARRAFRSAMGEGLEPGSTEFNTKVADFTQSPPEAEMEAAHNEALKMVLMKRAQFGTAQYHLQKAVNGNILAKIVMPFMQVGANILHESFIERTPLGLMSPTVRDNLMGKNGEAARNLQGSRIAVGIGISTAVVGLTAEGLLTGGGPSDPKQLAIKEMTGWRPYSIKVGESYVPYRKLLGGMGPLIAGTADIYEVGHTLSEEGLGKAAAGSIFGFAEVIADESWAKGLSNFIDAARHWDRDGERYLRNLAADFIPFSVGLSQITNLSDPYRREVRTLLDVGRNHIPGLSRGLFPVRDIWGEPIESHTALGPSQANHDPATKALLDAGYFPGKLERKIRGIELTDQQYDDLTRIGGRMARMRMNALVNTPGFAQMPKQFQADKIKDIITSARDGARSMILMQNQDIITKASAAKLAKFKGEPVH